MLVYRPWTGAQLLRLAYAFERRIRYAVPRWT
jgi:hypothetical protein